MKLIEFELLQDDEKIQVLYSDGVYIGKRKDKKRTVLLYQLDSFYVEVFYNKHRCIVSRLNCFSSTVYLDPYLTEIDVEHLVYTS